MLFPQPLASFVRGGGGGAAHECASLIHYCSFWPGSEVRSVKLLFTLMEADDKGRKGPSGMWEWHIQSFSKKISPQYYFRGKKPTCNELGKSWGSFLSTPCKFLMIAYPAPSKGGDTTFGVLRKMEIFRG